ncbi:MAG: 50S ribosomal protein L21 [Chloroflexi bacterium]|nr:50S ribosomal protein L21 [Chloroflexota bacterium]
MYAIVEVGGKQYRVAEGERVRVERLPLNEGQPYEINHVLLVGGDGQVEVGAPWVKGARVRATVMGHGRERKVTVFKFRRSGHY